MSIKHYLVCAAVCAAALGAPALAAPPTSNMPATNAQVSSTDFVNKAAISDMYEVAAGRIAEKRSQDGAIDRFAARMIRDHSRSEAELEAVSAKVGGLPLPKTVDEQHKGQLEELKSVDRKQFAATYAQQQIQGHRDAIALFDTYARQGDNAKLKQFAKTTLPVLNRHLAVAKTLPVGPQFAGGR